MKNHRFQTPFLAVLAGMFLFCQQAEGQMRAYYRYENFSSHGPVRSIVTTIYKKVPLQQEITPVDVSLCKIEEYDEKGVLKISSTYSATKLISRNTYYQNKKQGLYVLDDYNQKGDLTGKMTYLEDKMGNLTEIRSTNGATEYTSTKKEYDKRGNCIKIICFDIDGSVMSLNHLKYDKNNRVVSDSAFNGKQILTSSTHSEYNKKGQVVFQKIWTVNTFIMPNTTSWYRYLAHGKVVERRDSSNNQMTMNTTVYDKKGNMVERIIEKNGLKTRSVYSYNKYGDVVKMDDYKNNVLVEMTRFDFDEHDNWIRKTEVDLLNKTMVVTTREIKYDH